MTRTLLALFLVAAAAGSGCGEDSGRASAPAATKPVATVTATPAADEVPATAAVTIEGFTYSPTRVTVRRGGKVTWTDEDASNHTVTFDDDGPEDVGNLREGRSATVTFDERGSYAYICEFHPSMAGTVEVR
jgi:plastocyanin